MKSPLLFAIMLLPSLAMAATEAQTRAELLNLTALIDGLEANGNNVQRIEGLEAAAYAHLDKNDFNASQAFIVQATALIRVALESSLLIEETKIKISSLNGTKEMNATKINLASMSLEIAIKELQAEAYEQSLETARRAATIMGQELEDSYGPMIDRLEQASESAKSLMLSSRSIDALKDLALDSLSAANPAELEAIKEKSDHIEKFLQDYSKVAWFREQLTLSNISPERFNDQVALATIDFNTGDFNKAARGSEQSLETAQATLNQKARTDEIISKRSAFSNDGIYSEDAERLLSRSNAELSVGNHEQAATLAAQALEALEEARAKSILQEAQSKATARNREFLVKSLPYAAGSLLILGAMGLVLRRSIMLAIISSKTDRATSEIVELHRRIQMLQRDYFIHRKMPRKAYDAEYERLKSRIADARKKLSRLNNNIKI